MENVTIIKVESLEGVEVEHVVIAHQDGSFTSMTKAHYEELQAIKEQPLLGGN